MSVTIILCLGYYIWEQITAFLGSPVERNCVLGITTGSSITPDLDDLNEIWDFWAGEIYLGKALHFKLIL